MKAREQQPIGRCYNSWFSPINSPTARLSMTKKRQKLPGTVQKIIKPIVPGEVEKAQINVNGADHLYKEIRIENVVVDAEGKKAALKQGAEVDVIVEADSSATIKKPDSI
jgi:hypothetical protein